VRKYDIVPENGVQPHETGGNEGLQTRERRALIPRPMSKNALSDPQRQGAREDATISEVILTWIDSNNGDIYNTDA